MGMIALGQPLFIIVISLISNLSLSVPLTYFKTARTRDHWPQNLMPLIHPRLGSRQGFAVLSDTDCFLRAPDALVEMVGTTAQPQF